MIRPGDKIWFKMYNWEPDNPKYGIGIVKEFDGGGYILNKFNNNNLKFLPKTERDFNNINLPYGGAYGSLPQSNCFKFNFNN